MAAEITSITGLQNLPNLQEFNADYNCLETVDFSGLSNLTYIDISDCDLPGTGTPSLTSVNLSGCTSLEELRLDDSDFSSGFSDLNGLDNLYLIDVDDCGIVGSVDLSNLPSLKRIDFSYNDNLTELIITSSQPLGDGYDISLNNCALTQNSVDNILIALASGSVSNSSINIYGEGNGIPSEVGVESVRELLLRNWSVSINTYSTGLDMTTMFTSASEACAAVASNSTTPDLGFIYSGSVLEIGNYVYADNQLFVPKEDGWFGINAGTDVYLISGSNGLIVSSSVC